MRAPSRRVALRVLEEVDDLDELLLRLVDAGDVVERDALLPALLEAAGGRPAEATEDAATPGLPPRQPDQEPDQNERGREPEEEAQQKAAARIRRSRVDDDLLLRQHLRQPGAIDERRNLRLEPVDLDGLVVARWVVRRGLLQLALDRVLTRGDRLDVPGLDLLEEERLVRHPRAVRRRAGEERDQEVEDEQPDEEREQGPAAWKHRRLRRLLPAAVGRRIHPPAR